jgi:hypothetical protein
MTTRAAGCLWCLVPANISYRHILEHLVAIARSIAGEGRDDRAVEVDPAGAKVVFKSQLAEAATGGLVGTYFTQLVAQVGANP